MEIRTAGYLAATALLEREPGAWHALVLLDPDLRLRLVESFRADNALLSELTGRDFSDWLGVTSRGQFKAS